MATMLLHAVLRRMLRCATVPRLRAAPLLGLRGLHVHRLLVPVKVASAGGSVLHRLPVLRGLLEVVHAGRRRVLLLRHVLHVLGHVLAGLHTSVLCARVLGARVLGHVLHVLRHVLLGHVLAGLYTRVLCARVLVLPGIEPICGRCPIEVLLGWLRLAVRVVRRLLRLGLGCAGKEVLLYMQTFWVSIVRHTERHARVL
jgi:hypothetical protein